MSRVEEWDKEGTTKADDESLILSVERFPTEVSRAPKGPRNGRE